MRGRDGEREKGTQREGGGRKGREGGGERERKYELKTHLTIFNV